MTAPGLYKPFAVPSLTVPGNLFLAPLAGYSDAAFRALCLRWGAALAFTEMVSSEALRRGNCKTVGLLRRATNEQRLAVQIFAADPYVAAASVEALSGFGPSTIDLNCGCAVPKIVRSGCGAALLREPHRIGRILREVRGVTSVPISIKIRSGWDHDSINYLQVAQIAETEGASWVTLHPRSAAQGFNGQAEWTQIAALKSRLSIPVVGSGDLFCAQDGMRMLLETGCDAIMFARGALGNPFVFQQTRTLLTAGSVPAPVDPRLKLETALEHLKLALETKDEQVAVRGLRKHFCAYTRGLPASGHFRERVVRARSASEYEELVAEYLRISNL